MIATVRGTCVSVLYIWFTLYHGESAGTDCNNPISIRATHSHQYLTSPGYPHGYERNIACRWTITALSGETVQVAVTDIDLDVSDCPRCTRASWHRIEVTDGTSVWPNDKLGLFSNYNNKTLTSRRSSLTMSFTPRIDGSGGRGFKLKYYSGVFYDDSFAIVELEARSGNEVFVPPTLPPNYPNRFQMSWRITKTRANGRMYIKVLSSSLTGDCERNYMEAKNGYGRTSPSLGRWCGQETPEKYATGIYMFILLTCDSPVGKGFGFTIEYGTFALQPTTPASDGNNEVSKSGASIEVIAGSFVGIIAFCGVTYLVSRIVCDRMEMRDIESEHSEEHLSLENPNRQLPSPVVTPSAPSLSDRDRVNPSVLPPAYDDVMKNNAFYSPVMNT
ncbi:CUB domain-containing protein 2-like [Haliotis rufescens]|uniref:CUB domain-containing protein 2-like n=1 Tax=Haliotis rufescens TaxID=6454 RepID=UPI00201F65D5|nr:CUB domain-containing protein 2-like [Haliotis rufescens]